MKKLLFVAMAVVLLSACAKKTFKITGAIEGLDSGTNVILNKLEKGQPVAVDTVKMAEGSFTMEIDTMAPQLLVVAFDGQRSPVYLFGGMGDISIKGSIKEINKAEISGGSKETELFFNFNKNIPGLDRIEALRAEGSKAQMTGDTMKLKDLQAEYRSLMDEQLKYVKKFMEANTDNSVGALICLGVKEQYSVAELQKFINSFDSAKLGSQAYVVELKEAIKPLIALEEAKKATEVGAVAPLFTLKSNKGEEVKLEQFKGKVVLVDFWASWCAPCRQENPNVVKAYAKYSSKGFDILSVSNDREEDKWLAAITEDKLTWTQVRDVDGAVAQLYALEMIPTTFLLDKNGVIIAKNLRGEELTIKLEELLK
jgi:peroxiredoxin